MMFSEEFLLSISHGGWLKKTLRYSKTTQITNRIFHNRAAPVYVVYIISPINDGEKQNSVFVIQCETFSTNFLRR